MPTPTQTEVAGIAAKEEPLFRVRNLVLVIVGYALVYMWARWYEETYGWSAGLDAYAPEFETYWMNLLYAEIVLETATAAVLWGWLWKTRDRDLEKYWMHFLDKETAMERVRGAALREMLMKTRDYSLVVLTPREELRRNLTHLIWLAAYAWAFYWGASFFTEQDATWHQTVVRDTDFTPSHIIVFYLSYPIYIITGCSAFLYAKTRVPYFAKGLSVPYLFSVVGPFTILPNVGSRRMAWRGSGPSGSGLPCLRRQAAQSGRRRDGNTRRGLLNSQHADLRMHYGDRRHIDDLLNFGAAREDVHGLCHA